jgi:hypothetical protein
VPPLTNIALQRSKNEAGYFDPLDTPGFKVGISFVILFFGAGDW